MARRTTRTIPKGGRWHTGERYDIILGQSRCLNEDCSRTVVDVWVADGMTGGPAIYRRGEGKQIGNFHPVWIRWRGKKITVESMLRER